MVHLLTESAGLDESSVDDPLMVSFERAKSPHSAFGLGPHMCAGMVLARAELRIFIEEWLRRIPDFAVKAKAELKRRGGYVLAIEKLPLVWSVS
jgi:cytochrome P450